MIRTLVGMTAFHARLEAHAAATEAFLESELLGCDTVPARLRDAMRHAVLGGGKRFRPFLVIETAALFEVPAASAMPVAAALECLHCYSLVHDDLPSMDNDRLRRAKPTVWAAYDEWTAILAGDALLTLAFETVASERAHSNAAVRCELAMALARAAGGAGMVGGQTLDLMADKLGEPAMPDLAHVRRLQAMKTGALIQFACEAGAMIGGADLATRRALARFGSNLGLAFQIADDLLDATGDAATVGKATGKDAKAGKATQVGQLGVTAARAQLADAADAARGELAVFGGRGDILEAAVAFAAERVK